MYLESKTRPAPREGKTMDAPVTITFVWDSGTDGVAIKHDGQVVWQEGSFDRLSQYFRHSPEIIGVPVIIQLEDA